MRLTWLLLAAISAPTALLGQTEIWTKITATPGAASLVVTVAHFGLVGPDQALSGAATTIHDVLARDLTSSLFFVVREPDSGKTWQSSAAMVDFGAWASTGASVLIAGDISPTTFTIRLYDLISKRLIATKEYSRTGNDRALAHRVSDEIIKLLTGEEGMSLTRIAFARKVDSGRELYEVDQDGSNPRNLTADGRLKYSPDWSPDGGRIAYSSYYGDRMLVFSYDVATGVSTVVCDAAEMNDAPAWSPDGSMLAASVSTPEGSEIYVMDASGNGLHRVTHNGGVNTSPTWSPNSQQLAFVSDRTGAPQIYTISADGTTQERLTFEGNYNTTPAWSPRGDIIAYSRREGYGNQIFITDVNGITSKQLTFDGDNAEPCFSPDGLHIAFVSSRSGANNIYIMNWDGTDQRQLTRLGGCSGPAWSPPLD